MSSKSFELEGTVKVVLDAQTFASGFIKREFVLTTDDDYPQDVKFECVKDKVSLLDDVKEGDRLSATFSIRGNEYKDRFYVNLQAWKVEKLGGGAPDAKSASEDNPPLPGSDQEPSEEDDLPF